MLATCNMAPALDFYLFLFITLIKSAKLIHIIHFCVHVHVCVCTHFLENRNCKQEAHEPCGCDLWEKWKTVVMEMSGMPHQ